MAVKTARFAKRRDEILDVASEQINLLGARGMTLTAVARALNLDTSSVTYYFKRKDRLAAACLERTLEWIRDTASAAVQEPDTATRVRAFVSASLDLHLRQRSPGVPQLALLSDLGSLDEESRAPLDALYVETFALVRSMFDKFSKGGSLVRAVSLLAIIHWMPAWIGNYHAMDFSRVERAIIDAFGRGWGSSTAPAPLDRRLLEQDRNDDAQTRFLHSATQLINRYGYHGASVDRISAHLGVSVGSFYHHLDNKDDLVIACFERTFGLIEQAFVLGDRVVDDQAATMETIASNLLAVQFQGESPLLLMGAYQALPPSLRSEMLLRFARLSRHVAGVLADGSANGTMRLRDPTISAHCFMAMVTAASGVRQWAQRDVDRAIEEYLAVFKNGSASQ